MITQLQYLLLQSEFKHASETTFKPKIIVIVRESCAQSTLCYLSVFFPNLQAAIHTANLPCLERFVEIKSKVSIDF